MSDSVDEVMVAKKVKKSPPKTKLIFGLLFMLAVAAAAFMTFKYQDLKNNPNKATEQEQKSLIAKVGKLIDLPADEQPSIATVSDKEKLKDQAFFAKAENGDTLLIYTTAKKAILYRSSTNKVVEVAPIAIDTPPAGTAPAGN